MSKLIKLAIKNVSRNRKRTMITLVTIFIGVMASMMARGMIGAAQKSIIINVTQGLTGDFQIHKKGYLEATEISPLNLTISKDSEIEKKVIDEGGVFTRRIHFGGLLYADDETSTFFKGMALEPSKERDVCPLIEKSVFKGRFLSDENLYEAVLSKGLAEGMNIEIGDKVVMVGNDKNTSLNMREVEVVGLFESILPGVGKNIAYVNIKMAQDFLDMEDESTELAVRKKPLLELSMALCKKLKEDERLREYEINSWDEIAKLFAVVILFQKVFANVVVVIFFIMVTTAIVNTMVMAVFERINEIGMMRAMGSKRKTVKMLFFLESGLIGVIGGGVGIVVASILITVIGIVGITIYPPGSNVSIQLNPSVELGGTLFVYLFAVGMSLIAAFYPAQVAVSLNPIEAIRDV